MEKRSPLLQHCVTRQLTECTGDVTVACPTQLEGPMVRQWCAQLFHEHGIMAP
jgi:hypothetical protein